MRINKPVHEEVESEVVVFRFVYGFPELEREERSRLDLCFRCHEVFGFYDSNSFTSASVSLASMFYGLPAVCSFPLFTNFLHSIHMKIVLVTKTTKKIISIPISPNHQTFHIMKSVTFVVNDASVIVPSFIVFTNNTPI